MAREDHAHLLDAIGAIDPATLGYQEWVDVAWGCTRADTTGPTGTSGARATQGATTRASVAPSGQASAMGQSATIDEQAQWWRSMADLLADQLYDMGEQLGVTCE